MKETLIKFENELRSIGAPVLKYFNDGISREKIIGYFSEVHLNPTEEVIELFQWRNGTEYEDIPSGKINFVVNGCFMPLDDLKHAYLFDMIDRLYPKVFFPICTNDDFLINLDKSSKDYKKIFIYSPSLIINRPMTCFDSLPKMIETFTECFKQKAIWYNEEEYLRRDYDKYFSIIHEMNPNSKYWEKVVKKK